MLEGLTVAELHLNVQDDDAVLLILVAILPCHAHHVGLRDRLLVIVLLWRHLRCVFEGIKLAVLVILQHELLILLVFLLIVVFPTSFVLGGDVVFLLRGRLLGDLSDRFLFVRRPIKVLGVGSGLEESCVRIGFTRIVPCHSTQSVD